VSRLDAAVAAVERLGPLDERAMAAAAAHLDALTKPQGSLGRLEEVVVQLAGIAGEAAPPVHPAAIVVAAADHGIARRGVSAYPPEVTAQMVRNFLAGGAAINQLAAGIGAELVVLDLGVVGPVSPPGDTAATVRLVSGRIRDGTDDIATGPAMTRDEAGAAIAAGVDVAAELAARGVRLLGVGEMGIGNTTAASAIASVLTGFPPDSVTGLGTGLDADGRRRKVELIARSREVNRPDPRDPLGVLAAVGGLEIGALVGLVLGAAAARIPVVLDGFIVGTAALVACDLAPGLAPRLIAGHRSPEPGHAIVLQRLGLRPLLELELRLGEATGAALAMGVVQAAVRIRDGMATFDDAGVSGRA
jgi:nicotinate-nucleotide--dimethylbenzimidazole phosphoribosyltransferase